MPRDFAEAEPVARQEHHLRTNPDGTISGTVWTNDDQDCGYPSTESRWTEKYRDRAEMERRTGKSHTGVSGVIVEVFLDGNKI